MIHNMTFNELLNLVSDTERLKYAAINNSDELSAELQRIINVRTEVLGSPEQLTYEEQYEALVQRVLNCDKRPTRNEYTRSTFGASLVIDELKHGLFPILSGRKIYYKGILAELSAMLKGPKSLADFEKEGCNYWSPWAGKDGNLTVDYGNAWLDFDGYNQLEAVLQSLLYEPTGRRHLISGWRPNKLQEQSLPCCHLLYQWYVTNDGYLEMMWYQRSADVMVGVPSDVILAAAWNIYMASALYLQPGRITMLFGDTHIYEPHIDNAIKYCLNLPQALSYGAPTYSLAVDMEPNPSTEYLQHFTKDHIELIGYESVEHLSFEVLK